MFTKSSTRKTGYHLPVFISVTAFFLLLLFSEVKAGKSYNFSSSVGDDSPTSVLTQNSDLSWKTIKELYYGFSSFLSGDSVLSNRDESYYGSNLIKKSVTSSQPIIFGANSTNITSESHGNLNKNSQEAAGLTYYIDPAGNDLSGNGSIGAPWKSLYKACTTGFIK